MDHIHIYVKKVKGTKAIVGNLERTIKKHEGAVLSIIDLRTHVNISSDPSLKNVPLYMYKTITEAMKTGQNYDILLALQKSTRPGVAIQKDRALYTHYRKVHSSLDQHGIPHYCPNPPIDLRKTKREYSMN